MSQIGRRPSGLTGGLEWSPRCWSRCGFLQSHMIVDSQSDLYSAPLCPQRKSVFRAYSLGNLLHLERIHRDPLSLAVIYAHAEMGKFSNGFLDLSGRQRKSHSQTSACPCQPSVETCCTSTTHTTFVYGIIDT